MSVGNKYDAKPFIKWVGGKSHLITTLQDYYPTGLGVQITKYIEPFVGSGAVLFDLVSKYDFEEIYINDINTRLVNTYIAVRDYPYELIDRLEKYQKEFLSKDLDNRKIYYYNKRTEFNQLDPYKILECASLFIFLNKTCYNGLYRENSKGDFNVPIGRYKNPKLYTEETINNASKALENVTILNGDYKEVLKYADDKTFVYFDPPYRPISKYEAFTAYHKNSFFSDSDQIELGEQIKKISAKGSKILISNSDPKTNNEDDNFFDELYAEQDISRIDVRRFVNGKRKNLVSEIIVTQY